MHLEVEEVASHHAEEAAGVDSQIEAVEEVVVVDSEALLGAVMEIEGATMPVLPM